MAADEFRKGMRLFGGAVTVVSTSFEGRPTGLTATAVCSLSIEPPCLIACVNRHRFTYKAISESRTFSVNLLRSDQVEIAQLFAGMLGQVTDRFAEVAWQCGETGAPILTDALASFDCTVAAIVDSGTHGIVIGEVRAVHISDAEDAEPLLYADGQFTTIAPAVAGKS